MSLTRTPKSGRRPRTGRTDRGGSLARRGLVLLATCWLAAAPSHGALVLDVRDASLADALQQLQEVHRVSFVCVSRATRRLSDQFTADSVLELAAKVAAAYGCRMAAVGPALLAFDEPEASEALSERCVEKLVELLQAKRRPEGDLRSASWQVLKETCGGDPPKATGESDLSFAYRLTDAPRVAAVQAAFVAEVIPQVQGMARPRVSQARRLRWALVAAGPGEQDFSATVLPAGYLRQAPRGKEPREDAGAPDSARSAWPSAVLGLRVTVGGAESLGAALAVAAQQCGVEVVPPDVSGWSPAGLSFVDCPLWAVLDVVSVLTGRLWGPPVDAERYRFDGPERTLVSSAFALAPLSVRWLFLYKWRQNGRLLRDLLYTALPGSLRTEQPPAAPDVPLETLSQDCQERFWNLDRASGLAVLCQKLGDVEWVLARQELTGRFRIGRLGDIGASVSTGPSSSHALTLQAPQDTPFKEWFAQLKARDSAAMERALEFARKPGPRRNDPPRTSHSASRSDYGTRTQTGSRLRLRTPAGDFREDLVAGPPG